ncbi:hypothetical protein Mapa_006736 [Marchantia paleacea]|nr:hypothetical protein Mapa_006736 [Marchantia paleacea]
MKKICCGAELKEVVSDLEKEYDQCRTCWPTTIFSQGSLTERKFFCCSKVVRADSDTRMSSTEEDSGVFSGIRFMLAGFEPSYEKQYIEELEQNGGENAVDYQSKPTHVIVSNLAYDDPICAAARKDGIALVTDSWVPDCLDNGSLADVNSVLYSPLKDLDGIPGSEDLCICLTGYQGQQRQKIMRMVELIGARFTKPLLGNLVTHLICYKFEGEKYDLAKKTGLKLINHYWLEDCLKSWSLLPEADYLRSGWEVETDAKEPKIIEEKAEVVCTLVPQKIIQEKATEEVLSPDLVEVSTSRRSSGILDSSRAKSPSMDGTSCRNSPIPKPSSSPNKVGEQERHDTAQAEATLKQAAERKGAPLNLTATMEGIECSNALEVPDIFHEALMIADGRCQTSPVHVEKSTSSRSRRRSSCGVANQVSPVSPGFCEAAVAADECATIDCAMERMNICPDLPIKRRVSGIQGAEKSEPSPSRNAVDLESPENKRRKCSRLSRMGLSPPVTKDCSTKVQEIPRSPLVTKQVFSPSVTPLPGKHKVKDKRSINEEETQKGAISNSNSSKGRNREDAMDIEVTEAYHYLTSPGNKHINGDSNLRALQSKKVRDSQDGLLGPPKSTTEDPVEHSVDYALKHADAMPSVVKTGVIQRSSPISSSAVEREVDMEDFDKSLRSIRNSRKEREKKSNASKVRKSVDKSPGFIPSGSLTEDPVEHPADGLARHAEAVQNEGSRRTIKPSPPKSSSAAERKVDMDVDHSPCPVRKTKKGAGQKKCPVSKIRKSVDKSRGVVPPEEQDDVKLRSSTLNEGTLVNDDHTKKYAKKASQVTGSPPVSSAMAGDNEGSAVASEGVVQQNVATEAVEHEITLEAAAVKQSAKKLKGSSSRPVPRGTTVLKAASFVLPDEGNQELPKAVKQGAALETASVKQARTSAIQVPLSRLKKHHKSYPKGTAAVSAGEKEEGNTNDIPLKLCSQETSTKTPALASVSRQDAHRGKKPKEKRRIPSNEQEKENVELQEGNHELVLKAGAAKESSKKGARTSLLGSALPGTKKHFAVGGSTDARKNLHYIIKLLGAKVCTNRYQWKDDITHVVLPVPLRRTEKFLAGAAAGRWILQPEYVEASRKAGMFVDEEKYEWFGEGINEKGTISLQAPRKWRIQFARTGCGAFYGLRVVVYGGCISPPLETLKRAIRAGGGAVLATSPPYSQHLLDGVDFAIINPEYTDKDEHVQEFLRHEVACVTSDYIVDYICHPASSPAKHVLYKTHSAVSAADQRLQSNVARGPTNAHKFTKPTSKVPSRHSKEVRVTDDFACVVCGRTDDEKVMLLCGDGKGRGCGLATHIHCCSPPLTEVPEEDWFCRNCEDL